MSCREYMCKQCGHSEFASHIKVDICPICGYDDWFSFHDEVPYEEEYDEEEDYD